VPHGLASDLMVEAVEHDKDDVVVHRGVDSKVIAERCRSCRRL
jgi:hypothetical protein